jgi:O-antigen/teichoic acid export membrane protein
MIPASAVFVFLVPTLVNDVLGERWAGSVQVMQLLIVGGAVGLTAEAIRPLLTGIGIPRKVLWLDLWRFVILIALAWPLISWYGLVGAGVAWISALAVIQLIALRYGSQVLDRPFSGLTTALIAILVAAMAATAVAALVLNSLSGIPGIVAAIAASAVIAMMTILLLDGYFGLGLRDSLEESFPWVRQFSRR